MAKKGNWRGLDALLVDNAIDEKVSGNITTLKLSDIEPNRGQARTIFEESALLELADSIGKHGILQPIAVRKKDNGYYEIIAGERRWRAAKMAGLTEVPVIIKDVDDKVATELSLIENLQRENLNAVEEAKGYKDLMERFDLTQEEAAERVGKSRTAVANILRILKLPESVLNLVEDGSLSYGHARTLLPLTQLCDEEGLLKHAKTVINSQLSVRQTEQLVKQIIDGSKKYTEEQSLVSKTYYKKLESDISDVLGRKATIHRSVNGTGKITISFAGAEDLEELITQLCGKTFFNEE
ncbi:MAG: ParB/RepB/Spo0J family partition protein [Clostridia bacterium]|nr:ParB/RepB/Spo0J family partition protein [Clostridia bacterium]